MIDHGLNKDMFRLNTTFHSETKTACQIKILPGTRQKLLSKEAMSARLELLSGTR